jgi:glycine cleavage system H protein
MVSMGVKNKNYPLIPEEERKCVWMTTGLISYKLCDKNFQCEICPFDQAIKNEDSGERNVQESEDDWAEGSIKMDPSVRINGSIFYHPDHCWVIVDHPEKVKIGIDDLIARLITNVKVVVLPRIGSFIGQGECCAHVIQEDYILPVIAPLSGTIQAVNPRLKKEPELITDAPKGEGWLVMIKPDNLESELKKLLFGRKALAWYKSEEKAIIARADRILKHNPKGVGPTMQDGGVRIDCLHDLLNHVTSQQKTQILDFSITRPKKMEKNGT